MKARWIYLIGLFMAGIFLYGNGTMDIVDIEGNPRKYVGTQVDIAGEVTQVRRIPLTEYQLQSFYDGTAMMTVLTSTPREVGQADQVRISIVGLNTQAAEGPSVDLADSLGELFLKEEWLEPQEAQALAEKLGRALTQILRAMDISLLGVEKPSVDVVGSGVI